MWVGYTSLIKTDSEGNETFSSGSNDIAYSVQPTRDGGYVLAGMKDTSISGGEGGAWLIKTDSKGQEIWNRTLRSGDAAFSVQSTNDGGYILAGYNYSFGADAWLVKTDSAGNELWKKTFGGKKDDYAFSCQIASDRGYILAGYTESYGAGGRDAWLIKVAPG